jgi:hypothetical protein
MNNKDLILNFKDALLLLTVLFIGPKKCRVSYQLLALYIHTDALALLIFLFSTVQKIDIMKAKDRHNESKRC